MSTQQHLTMRDEDNLKHSRRIEENLVPSRFKQTSVLLVEDNLADAVYVEEMLPSAFYKVQRVSSLAAAHEINSDSIDVVLLDLSLPDGHGLQTCVSMIEHAPLAPIIILTGLEDEEIGLRAVKLGAQDFILKREITESTLARSIRYAIERKSWEEGVRQSAIQAKQSEAQAREIAANLELSLKASNTGVWSWDFVNDKLKSDSRHAALFECDEDNFGDTLQHFLDRIHVDDRDATAHAIKSAVKEKTGYHTEFRTVWSDGSTHYITARGQVLSDRSGVAVFMAGICTDVTSEKEEQENAKRLLVLEKHEDFIATLTHDLKNPLIGAERLLEMFMQGQLGPLEDEQRKLIGLMRQSNSDMLALIHNLLEVYRFDAGAPPFDFSQVEVAKLSAICVEQLRGAAQAGGVDLSTNFLSGDHTITVDIIALRRVLMNLVGNAIKFTQAGGIITVSGKRVGEHYILEVTDNGSGIAPDDVEQLFRRFSQAKSTKRYGTGTGLGLYLCRQLVEAHGGQITCTSVDGAGTVFTVVLPIDQ
ncbi:hypothetical protein BH10CYA1_BH10CYA1_60920 [soil metagenome]